MTQSTLYEPHFNGPEYNPELDFDRLTGQMCRIYHLMKDGKWRTLTEIQKETGDPQASISAQLRHLRKQRFGLHTINRRRVEGRELQGLFEYQLIINPLCKIVYVEEECRN
ncbi:MAG TPA: hypothetical protein VMY59_08295 [Candidatus Thermoplasmatota archaeon]|nr:hypothetical protein [Candidatus Thermoplasmatota archaeon]